MHHKQGLTLASDIGHLTDKICKCPIDVSYKRTNVLLICYKGGHCPIISLFTRTSCVCVTGEVNSNCYVFATSKVNPKLERLLSKSLTTLEVLTYYLVVHTGPVLSVTIMLPTAPQCHPLNTSLVFQLILHPLLSVIISLHGWGYFLCTLIRYIGFMGVLFLSLIECFSMIIWTPTVLSVLYACILYFCICTCSAQLSMFHMERRSRNMLLLLLLLMAHLLSSAKRLHRDNLKRDCVEITVKEIV